MFLSVGAIPVGAVLLLLIARVSGADWARALGPLTRLIWLLLPAFVPLVVQQALFVVRPPHLVLWMAWPFFALRGAAAIGVDGIVVSNHGARQMDGLVGPTEVLAPIAQEVGQRLTVLADSGVRRGSDIAKFLALGAQGVMVGRATLYGMAAAGAAGATTVLDILRRELSTTMAFLGVTSLADLPATLHPRSD